MSQKERKNSTIKGGWGKDWIILAPRLPWCLIAILLRKETAHHNYVLNILLLDRYPFPEHEKNAFFQSFYSSELVTHCHYNA